MAWVLIATQKEFSKATAEWRISRLVEVWNSFAGVAPFTDCKPVKKFENRGVAAARIWAAIQKLSTPAPAEGAKPCCREESKPVSAKATKPKAKAKADKANKKAAVIAMLQRKGRSNFGRDHEGHALDRHTVPRVHLDPGQQRRHEDRQQPAGGWGSGIRRTAGPTEPPDRKAKRLFSSFLPISVM
jgi:hypothetical protein